MPSNAALPAELTIYTVGELRPPWLSWLDQAGEEEAFEVDAAAVAEVDGAGLQLLQSLARALAARHRSLHLLAPSPALRAACEGLGLQALLDDADDAARSVEFAHSCSSRSIP